MSGVSQNAKAAAVSGVEGRGECSEGEQEGCEDSELHRVRSRADRKIELAWIVRAQYGLT